MAHFEVLRCTTCGKIRLFTPEVIARTGYGCSRCGGSAFRNTGRYSLLDRLRLAYWCVRENAREGNMRSWTDYLRAFRLGLNPVVPEGN